MKATAVAAGSAIALAAGGGCGGSSNAPAISGRTVGAVCAQTAGRLAAIARRRILHNHGSVIVVGPSKQASERQRDVEAALSEDAAVYAAAIPAVERLRPADSSATVALAHLEEAAHRIETLRAEFASGHAEPGSGALFAVAEASGGCRKVRSAIGG